MSATPLLVWAQDAHLDPALRLHAPLTPHLSNPRSILLTGATGFLGAFLLDELLRRTDAVIYCLARGEDEATTQARLAHTLRGYGLWREEWAERIVALPGDLAQPSLGLTDARFAELAGEIDAIYHNGAWVNALYPYNRLRAANVGGSLEIIRLATTQQTKALHYISTLAIFLSDAHINQPVDESRIPVVDPTLQGGYKQSKWVAEALMREAQTRHLPVTIHRPGRILGHSQSGVNGNLNDLLCTVLKSCVDLGCYPEVPSQIDFIPVDYVAQAIVQLGGQPGAVGQSYHFCHPQPLEWNDLLAQIAGLGYPLAGVSYAAWVAAVNDRAAQSGADPIFQQLRMLLRAPIFLFAQAKPHFSGRATQQALAPLTCPAIDQELIATYFTWFQQTGYLPPASQLSPALALAERVSLA